MNSDKVQLTVMGITRSQLKGGAYALVLRQSDGPYRVPVLIGAAEAQAIAVAVQGITPPRPLMHDVVTTMHQAFGIRLQEVLIHHFDHGLFLSELLLQRDDPPEQVRLDCRTSDAVALALRQGAPIYIKADMLAVTGFTEDDLKGHDSESGHDNTADIANLDRCPMPLLKRMLQDCVEREQYEQAAQIQKAINARGQNQT